MPVLSENEGLAKGSARASSADLIAREDLTPNESISHLPVPASAVPLSSVESGIRTESETYMEVDSSEQEEDAIVGNEYGVGDAENPEMRRIINYDEEDEIGARVTKNFEFMGTLVTPRTADIVETALARRLVRLRKWRTKLEEEYFAHPYYDPPSYEDEVALAVYEGLSDSDKADEAERAEDQQGPTPAHPIASMMKEASRLEQDVREKAREGMDGMLDVMEIENELGANERLIKQYTRKLRAIQAVRKRKQIRNNIAQFAPDVQDWLDNFDFHSSDEEDNVMDDGAKHNSEDSDFVEMENSENEASMSITSHSDCDEGMNDSASHSEGGTDQGGESGLHEVHVDEVDDRVEIGVNNEIGDEDDDSLGGFVDDDEEDAADQHKIGETND